MEGPHLRAQRQAQYVLARRLARWFVRRVWLGTQARLIFDRPCALTEAPDLLRDAVADLASRLGGTAHQMFTAAGNPEVGGGPALVPPQMADKAGRARVGPVPFCP